MTAVPDDFVEQLRRQADATRVTSAARWVEELGSAATPLVAVPTWTDRLAVALHVCDEAGVLIDRLWRNGQVEMRTGSAGSTGSTGSDDPGGSTTFWMTDAARAAWSRALGYVADEQLVELAGRIRQAWRADPAVVPTATSLWVGLVEEADMDGARVLEQIRKQVRGDDLAGAGARIDAADGLAAVVHGTWPGVVDRARRLLYLGYRRRHDRDLVDEFVERDAELDAIRGLLRGDDDVWALHLRGQGGVGKTMLVRYLASERFAESPWWRGELTIARVDFDHMSADYPSRRPVQLLEMLLDELLLHATTGVADRLGQELRRAVEQVHTAASTGDLPFDHPLVTDAIDRFGSFCNELPPPVVIVLDTCEELAKLHPVASVVPTVERTFEIFEAVHRACPSVRVLLSGRRYLARGGHGWRVPASVPSHVVTSLTDRPYLAMHEVGGYTEDEAVEYLLKDPAVDEATARARLARLSEAAGGGYNPFLVSLYRIWWQQEGSAAVDDLVGSAADAYVEQRIVARLRDADMLDLLPVIALLGRFDADLLAQARDGEPVGDEVVSRLADQEWLTFESGEGAAGPRFVVEDALRPLLLRWARHPSRISQTDRTARQLADALCERVADAPLADLTAEVIEGALRLAAPIEAARVWEKLEDRIGIDARWDWAANILARVRGDLEEDSDRSLDPLVDAAVRATEIAVAVRRAPHADYLPAWQEVGRLAELAGDDADGLGERLRERARLGMLRYSPDDPEELLREHASRLLFDRWSVDASVAATLETLIGRVPLASWPRLRRLTWASVLRLTWPGAPAVAAATATTSTVLSVRSFVDDTAAELITAADAAPQRTWADWPEQDGRDHIVWNALVEAAVGRSPTSVGFDLGARLAQSRQHTIEGDRLLGLVIRQRQEQSGPLDPAVLDAFRIWDRYLPPPERRPHALYDDLPPLFVELARAYFRAGRPADARAILETRRDDAVKAKHEDRTVRQADIELVWLALRMRWPGFERSLVRQLSDGPDDRALSLALALRIVVEGDDITSPWSWPLDDADEHVHALEVDAVLRPPDERAELVAVADARAQRDPITALQLLTCAALTAREGWRPGLISRVRSLYPRVASLADLPEWGRIASRIEPDDPWAPWLTRWGALDGSLAVAPPSGPELARWFGTSAPPPESRDPSQRVLAPMLLLLLGGTVGILTILFVRGRAGSVVGVVLGTGLLMLAIAGVTLLVEPYVAWLNRLQRLEVWVHRDPDEGRKRRIGLRPGMARARLGRRRYERIFGPSSRTAEVVDGAPKLAPLLAGTARRMPACPATLVLDDEEDHELGWEAAILDPRVGSSWRFAWLRSVHGVGVRRDWPSAAVAISAPVEWERLLRSVYGPLVGEVSIAAGVVRSRGVARIHHAIGTAIETRHGALVEQSAYDDIEGRVASQRGGLGGMAPLVVLQDPPLDGPLAEATRSAAVLRTVAFELARDTAATVICLPALPPTLALDVIGVLERVARRRRRPGDVALAKIVVAMKERIRSWDGPAVADPRIIAQQIVVFRPA